MIIRTLASSTLFRALRRPVAHYGARPFIIESVGSDGWSIIEQQPTLGDLVWAVHCWADQVPAGDSEPRLALEQIADELERELLLLPLRNPFHGTEIKRPSGRLSPASVARGRARLCGVDGCMCATSSLGTRGPQALVTDDGVRHPIIIDEEPDGGVNLSVCWAQALQAARAHTGKKPRLFTASERRE